VYCGRTIGGRDGGSSVIDVVLGGGGEGFNRRGLQNSKYDY